MNHFKNLWVTGFLLFVSIMITGCSSGIRIDVGDSSWAKDVISHQERKTAKDEFTIDKNSSQEVDIAINMGKIVIRSGEDDQVKIDVRYEARGEDEETLTEILDTVTIVCEDKKGSLKIAAVNKETNEDIWNWIRDRYHKDYRIDPTLEVSLAITLPKSISEFHIDNAMGEIQLSSVSGEFYINNDMGQVKLENVQFAGESDITVAMGDLRCELAEELEESAEVNLEVDMGNISIDTNGFSYITDEKDDDNFMGASSTVTIQELCKIRTEVAMGKVSVRK